MSSDFTQIHDIVFVHIAQYQFLSKSNQAPHNNQINTQVFVYIVQGLFLLTVNIDEKKESQKDSLKKVCILLYHKKADFFNKEDMFQEDL